jgi:aryl-alcohol dehydrogenase-like predicted oxidoreductase
MWSRRELLKVLPAAALAPSRRLQTELSGQLTHRLLGRTGRWVTPLGLGGMGALMYPVPGMDMPDIVVRAVELGINYLDTANAYGPSQTYFGEAFRRLRLIPGEPEYNAALRERLYIASKTLRRYALDRTSSAATAIDELKRTLTQLFGYGSGYIPEGAYLDCMQVHDLYRMEEVDPIYEGLDRREARPARIGALAGLLDYRDGTNLTGLNPERRHYLRHIGVSSHQSSAVLMNVLQRDELNIIDTLLTAVNPNDRWYCSHQHNVIRLAMARGVGVIAMKALAGGVFYGGPTRFSSSYVDLILTVGKPSAVSHTDLVRYSVSIPGVSCLLTGIGRIDRENADADQLVANLKAALGDVASPGERRRIEEEVAERHGVDTNNHFQERRALVQPTEVRLERDGDRVIVRWNTALAGSEPIRSYNVYAGDRQVASLPYRPQTSLTPLAALLPATEITSEAVRVEASEELPRDLGA